jgi:hypothetical protein
MRTATRAVLVLICSLIESLRLLFPIVTMP